MMCDNITEYGVIADHLHPVGSGDRQTPQTQRYFHTAHQTHVHVVLLKHFGLMPSSIYFFCLNSFSYCH